MGHVVSRGGTHSALSSTCLNTTEARRINRIARTCRHSRRRSDPRPNPPRTEPRSTPTSSIPHTSSIRAGRSVGAHCPATFRRHSPRNRSRRSVRQPPTGVPDLAFTAPSPTGRYETSSRFSLAQRCARARGTVALSHPASRVPQNLRPSFGERGGLESTGGRLVTNRVDFGPDASDEQENFLCLCLPIAQRNSAGASDGGRPRAGLRREPGRARPVLLPVGEAGRTLARSRACLARPDMPICRHLGRRGCWSGDSPRLRRDRSRLPLALGPANEHEARDDRDRADAGEHPEAE
jgi:hypothetical protein